MKALTDASGRETLTTRLLKRLPGGEYMQEKLDQAERRILQELKGRLDQVGPPPQVSVLAVSMRSSRNHSKPVSHVDLGSRIQAMLNASSEMSREQAEADYYDLVLRNLLPDHVRILSALADGSAYPLIHIYAGPRFGLATDPAVECISNVGKSAGVMRHELTHIYVQQLRGWGLTGIGPEDPAQKTAYEILETNTDVRNTITRLQKSGLKGHIIRRTLHASETGKALWAASRVGEDISEVKSFKDIQFHAGEGQ